MGTLVQTTFIAHNFTGIESRSPPARRFCSPTIEALSAQVLGLLGRSIVGMHDRDGAEAGVEVDGGRGDARHG